MEDAQPTREIGAMQSTRSEAPSQLPPAFARIAGMAQSFETSGATTLRSDMQATPSLSATTGITASATVWQDNKRVNGLWTINQDRNSWMSIAGIGWQKLANPNETAVVALTMLAAHALSANAAIYYRNEADNMVHEIYVW